MPPLSCATRSRACVASHPPTVQIEHLRFGYGSSDVVALEAFTLAQGERALVIGASGCGKTTLLHLVAGLLVPRSGRIAIDGVDLGALAPAARDRFRGQHIGVVLQQFHLLPTLTAVQNLLVAQSVAALPVDRASAAAMLDSLGVGDKRDARPHELSVGQQQRVAIARALVNRPRLLLADEPTSNLDDKACATVAALLLDAAVTHGASLLVATHDSRLIESIPRHLAMNGPRSASAREVVQ